MVSEAPKILCSIVSHGQAELLANLLQDLDKLDLGDNVRIIVTENTPNDRSIETALRTSLAVRGYLKTLQNLTPLGFAANQNQAYVCGKVLFEAFSPDVFVVLNPDLRLKTDVINALALELVADVKIGVIAPEVFTSDGQLEDSARFRPSVARIAKKLLFNDRGMFPRDAYRHYYPDIVCGMCMAFSAKRFWEIQGFDEAYFMYYEDADICLRLRENGSRVVVDPTVSIVHDAQRVSHRDWKMKRIHLRSMFRFFSRRFRHKRALASGVRNISVIR